MIAIDFNKRNAVTLGGGKDSWLAIAVDVTTNKLLLEEVVDTTSLEKLCGSLEALHDRPTSQGLVSLTMFRRALPGRLNGRIPR